MGRHDRSGTPLRRVGILVFDNVEVLAFAGPFEVFAAAAELAGQVHFKTVLVGKENRVFTAVNGLKVLPDETFAHGHAYGLLVVPGGFGTRALVQPTTHHEVLHELAAAAPGALVVDDQRFVDEGAVITCGGIFAGIDGRLHVRRRGGDAAAARTAACREHRGG